MNDDAKLTVLVVDDSPENIDILHEILHGKYTILFALNGKRALSMAEEARPDIILLDVMMPEMDGFEVCRRLKNNPLTNDIPVIFITANNQPVDEELGIKLGAVDYLSKPVNPAIVLLRVEMHLALYNQRRELIREVKNKTREVAETQFEIIKKLGIASEFKDNETGLHVDRVSQYSFLIAQEMGLNEEECDLILNASPMHDIGKIGIPDSILLKPGKLDPDEWETMKSHSLIGAKIIGDHPARLLQVARLICLQHHEKWNGSGYPDGLKGEEISLYARIVAICDVFDALTSDRPYKKAWTVEKAAELICEESEGCYDPAVLEAFNKVLPELKKIREHLKD